MSAAETQVHVVTLDFRNDEWTARCACTWKGTSTRWSAAAQRDADQHLSAVGQPALPPLPTRRSDNRRRYVG